MIERVIENWLINVNERSFEIPFCQLLTSEGYQVVHLSRHGPYEQGKDVIAIDPNGSPCAFQIKGSSGKITQNAWAKSYLEQAIRLVELPIVHPSINQNLPRKVFFVTNGELDEEVRIEIENRNSDWQRRGFPKLETIVKGQLLTRLLNLQKNFWPFELSFEKEFLELYLSDGTACLDKSKQSTFLQKLLKLDDEDFNKAESNRLLINAAITTAYTLTPYEENSNYVAIFEGWVIYISYLVAFIEKHQLNEKYWHDSISLASQAIENILTDLCVELSSRQHLVEGNPLVDQPFYRGRITWLVGLVSTYKLWNQYRIQRIPEELDKSIIQFIHIHQKDLFLWGEGAIPDFLANFWAISEIEPNKLIPISLLELLISTISLFNMPNNGNKKGLPDPYHDLSDVIETQLGLGDSFRKESFLGQSYTLESLVNLLAKRSWRKKLSILWHQISRIWFIEFQPNTNWEYCLWHVENGTLKEKHPNTPQSWEELRDESRTIDYSRIPTPFQKFPELLLVFLMVFPHRLVPNTVKFLDETICRIRRNENN